MKTVHEVSELTGVSVRALHHYDAVGLLKPTAVTEAGYRLYDDAAIARLQSILLFRELEFPLKSIKAILDSPEFDARAAMLEQIKLLELRREQIDRLILLARETIETGEINMDFSAFDKSAHGKIRRDRRSEGAFARLGRGSVGGQGAAELHHRAFLHLHRRGAGGSRADVYGGRALQEQYRLRRRQRHCRIHRQSDRDILQ